MWLIIIIILIILLCKEKNKVEELLNDNMKLKKELENIKKNNLSENIFDENILNLRSGLDINSKEESVKQLINEEKRKKYIEKEKKEIEGRNTLILITGAILIVLSAIVFLMSTWYTIPNLLKTIVLVLLILVFFGASNIAKEKFELFKASITFFYIAMAYIPICLFSISFFGLLGNYLSITGEGNYIYLTISAIITSIIYYLIYKNKNNEILFIGSLLSQVLSVILFTLIFSNKLELIIFNLALYNLLFIILTKDNGTISKLPYIHSMIPYTTCFIAICTINEITSIITLINFIILAINFIILELKENKVYHAFGFNIVINIIGNYCIWNLGENFLESTKIIFSLIYTISIFIIENAILIGKSKSNLKRTCLIITMGILQLLFFNSLDNKNILIKPYIISFVQCIILFIGYLQLEKKEVISYLIPIYFIISGITLLSLYELEYHYYIIFAILTFLLGESLKEKRLLKIKENSFIISNIFVVMVYSVIAVVYGKEFKNDIIYFVVLLGINIYSYLRSKNNILKYLAYFNFYILIYVVTEFLKFNNNYINNIIFIACSICCYIFERKPRDKDIFEVLTYIGSLILYNRIIEDIELSEYALFTFLGYIIITILILRRILEKYIDKKDIDIIEAIIIGLIYLIAIFSYSGEYDGILFGILIVSMLIFSYIRKHGTLFLVNIGAILINVFLLTREFWFSIPWWIYLLVIGSILITFAIKNEANEKQNKFNVKNSLKRIKDSIEK